jgi:hypothetical protein
MRKRKQVSKVKIGMAALLFLILVTAISLAPRGPILTAYADDATHADRSALVVELRRNTQILLDAIALGDVAVWDKLLDPAALQIDENDVVRRKPEILAELKPLGPGLAGHISIDDFRVAASGDVAIVTHEDDETLDYHGQMIRSRFRATDTWHKTSGGWRLLGSQVLAVLQDPPSVTLDSATLCAYAGRYALTNEIVATIRCADEQLLVDREEQPERRFLAEVKDVFFEPGRPRTRRIFLRNAEGRITAFVERREGRDVRWTRQSDAAS